MAASSCPLTYERSLRMHSFYILDLSQGRITLSLKSPPPDGFEAMEFYMEYLTHYSHYAATIDALNEFNDANFPLKRYLKKFY